MLIKICRKNICYCIYSMWTEFCKKSIYIILCMWQTRIVIFCITIYCYSPIDNVYFCAKIIYNPLHLVPCVISAVIYKAHLDIISKSYITNSDCSEQQGTLLSVFTSNGWLMFSLWQKFPAVSHCAPFRPRMKTWVCSSSVCGQGASQKHVCLSQAWASMTVERETSV